MVLLGYLHVSEYKYPIIDIIISACTIIIILFHQMRFLDCTQGKKDPSKSILDVGVENAIKFSGFDEVMFKKRGGRYVWSKADMKLDW